MATHRRLSQNARTAVVWLCLLYFLSPIFAKGTINPDNHDYTDASSEKAYDITRAKEICDSLSISDIEGIWKFPEDGVTVLVCRNRNIVSSEADSFSISVVETSDARIHPGQHIGTITASPNPSKYQLELFTHSIKRKLSKSEKCVATLSADSRSLTMSQPKSNFRIRASLSLSTLLPRFWRIVRLTPSISQPSQESAPVGMIKIYPSYDGDGSSTRQHRYL